MSFEQQVKDLAATMLADVIDEAGAHWARTPDNLKGIVERAVEVVARVTLAQAAGMPVSPTELATYRRAVANLRDVQVGGTLAARELVINASGKAIEALIRAAKAAALRALGF